MKEKKCSQEFENLTISQNFEFKFRESNSKISL